MFLVKAGTVIQVQVPKRQTGWFNWNAWQPYTTTEDKVYDKEEVWDAVAILNGRSDVPDWAHRNITEFNKVILNRKGKYAMINPKDVEFLG